MGGVAVIRNELLHPTATNRFLAENSHRVRTPQSKVTYENQLSLLQRAFPGQRVGEFAEADLVSFCQATPAPGSQLKRRNVCVAFFSWATHVGLCDKDPSGYLRQLVKPRNHGVKHHNWLSEEQVAAVAAACKDGTDKGLRDWMIIVVASFTGLRRSELAGLRWGDVDLSGARLRVIGKGEKPAEIGLGPRVLEALFEWRSRCALGLGRPVSLRDPVFPRTRVISKANSFLDRHGVVCWDEAVGTEGIWIAVRSRGEQAGVMGLAPHDLRRSFAGLLESQKDLLTVSRALRHANVGTTQRYLENNPRRAVEAGQGFDIAL